MKLSCRSLALVACILITPPALADMAIDSATRASVVEAVAQQLAANYVFADVAARVGADLRLRLSRGDYAAVTSGEAFATLLTQQLRAQTKDEHLGVFFVPTPLPADNPPGFVPNPGKTDPQGWADRLIRSILAAQKENFGFGKSERLAGNVAYVKIDEFYEPAIASNTVAAELSQVADASALIVDLRGNGGGSPDTGALVSAYLFDAAPVLLTEHYTRGWKRTESIWTRPVASDLRFGSKKPVYVLVDKATFSAAEDFVYALQALKRVTVVGENTKGGAHTGRGFKLGQHFLGSIPHRVSINPVTHTDWEGTGIKPDVAVPAEKALSTALALAARSIAGGVVTQIPGTVY